MVAFGFYNMVFIGGNWAYVQRYTSVPTKREAKKVGNLFGWLYLFSPVVWMLPPMLYRLLNVDLAGLENEGAYLMMCKEVLPAGMMGLMITGMIFATTDSVNASLNVSSAVFTNDVYKRLYPKSPERSLMWVARISTLAFGVVTVLVALMVPAMGGIVEVVLSIGALTGVPLYSPAVWALFSKRQTAFSILFTTIMSLVVNVFFKFISPGLLGVGLGRMEETVLGVSLPILLLTIFELIYRKKPYRVANLVQVVRAEDASQQVQGAQQSQLAIKTVAFALIGVGIMILVLGLMAETGKWSVVSVAGAILVLGLVLIRRK